MGSARKLLGETARAITLFFVVLIANLIAVYIIAGVAFHGNWDRVNDAIEDAYYEFIER